MKLALLFAAGLAGAAAICPLCGGGPQSAGAQSLQAAAQAPAGVVRYDPRQVNPAQIAAHLTRLTGFGATILPDTKKSPGGSR